MRIVKPVTSGKIILTYRGSRIALREIDSKYFSIGAITTKKVDREVEESLAVKVKLFDDQEVFLCLISRNVYLSKIIGDEKIWYKDENSYINYNPMIVDNTLAILTSDLYFNHEIGGEIIQETYNFQMIFNHPKEIRHQLKKHDVEFEDYYIEPVIVN